MSSIKVVDEFETLLVIRFSIRTFCGGSITIGMGNNRQKYRWNM